MRLDVRPVAGVPERQPRQQPVAVAVLRYVPGGTVVGVEDREAADPPVYLAHEFLRVVQRHPLRRVVVFDVERQEVVRAGFGGIDLAVDVEPVADCDGGEGAEGDEESFDVGEEVEGEVELEMLAEAIGQLEGEGGEDDVR